MARLTLACVQMRTGTRIDDNLAAAHGLIRSAAEQGAGLIATPEMTPLMDIRPGRVAAQAHDEAGDPALAALRDMAREVATPLLIGSLPVRAGDGRLANRSMLVGADGEILARYDKIHMFDVVLSDTEAYRESATYAPGQSAVTAQVAGLTLGMSVCYDVRFPHLYRALAEAGAELLAVPSAFTATTGRAHWHVLLRARAIETGCFVMAPAQAGKHEDGRETYGHSLIVGPWGEILAEGADTPGLVTAEIDTAEVAKARARIPAMSHTPSFKPPQCA